ncbi:MAG: metal-dependent transcriptional regulator [Candidatus Bathyarchaeota archaeon]|nr:metal-dependent transcriptional regulator [Candidatus Bathyarchaeota archaeon]
MPRRNIEDYLKAIYDLSKNGQAVSTTEIAQALRIAPASVTEMLKKLANKGYITHSLYHGTTLTNEGQRLAEKIARKHRLLERFLHDVLRIDKEKVHSQACEMEHSLSDEAEESLCRFLKHPDRCPDDGKMIPPCNLQIESCAKCIQLHEEGLEEAGKHNQKLVAISNLKEGQCGKIAFIRGGRNIVQRLLDMGLTPGAKICVVRVAPLGGPVELAVRNSKLALGKGVSSKIFVEIESPTAD